MALGDFGMLNVPVQPDMWKQVNSQYDALLRAQTAMAAQENVAQLPLKPDLAGRARELFLKRMGGIRGEMLVAPADFLQCHVYGEVVHVFYCFSGKPGVAQESIDLFPSDQFITQFRLILS
jgi:hypothetical protein